MKANSGPDKRDTLYSFDQSRGLFWLKEVDRCARKRTFKAAEEEPDEVVAEAEAEAEAETEAEADVVADFVDDDAPFDMEEHLYVSEYNARPAKN